MAEILSIDPKQISETLRKSVADYNFSNKYPNN